MNKSYDFIVRNQNFFAGIEFDIERSLHDDDQHKFV